VNLSLAFEYSVVLIFYELYHELFFTSGTKPSNLVSKDLQNFLEAKMIKKYKLKQIWLAVAVISLILLGFHWFGYDSRNLEISILVLNAIGFVLSLPCSFFVVPVITASFIYLGIFPASSDGVYLNTIFIFVVGMMQWFFVSKYWTAEGNPMQTLGLKREGVN